MRIDNEEWFGYIIRLKSVSSPKVPPTIYPDLHPSAGVRCSLNGFIPDDKIL